MREFALLLALTGPPAIDAAPFELTPRQIEIKMFVSTMAIAQAASDECPDILIDVPYLADLQRRLKIDANDAADVERQGRFVLDTLHQALMAAPSRDEWCDAVYRLYGSEGSLIPNLMRQEKSR